MATDRVVIERALRELDGTASGTAAAELAARTTVAVPTDSQKIQISVLDEEPERAAALANAIADSFADLVTREQVARLNLSATTWQPAVEPTSPASPNLAVNLVAATLLGLLAAATIAAVREALDATWRSERDIEATLDLPVLVVIPELHVPRRRIGAAR
jgi:capsular polysaccharide biosynthesis protein